MKNFVSMLKQRRKLLECDERKKFKRISTFSPSIRMSSSSSIFREKQDARDHMIGYLGSLQKRAEADYDTQIFRARAEREAKELREEQEKLEKQRKMQDAIDQHRHETVGNDDGIFFSLTKKYFQLCTDETSRS